MWGKGKNDPDLRVCGEAEGIDTDKMHARVFDPIVWRQGRKSKGGKWRLARRTRGQNLAALGLTCRKQ